MHRNVKFFEKKFRGWGNGWAKIACSKIFGRGWATGGVTEEEKIWTRGWASQASINLGAGHIFSGGGGAGSVRASLGGAGGLVTENPGENFWQFFFPF